jgi:hypothetical protein
LDAVTLYCRTSGGDFRPSVARIELTAVCARKLLSYRELAVRALDFDERFLRLEFLDATPAWGSTDAGEDLDEDDGPWVRLPAGCDFTVPADQRLESEIMSVTDAGVSWRAQLKHGDGVFETGEVGWGDLLDFVRGVVPWPEVADLRAALGVPRYQCQNCEMVWTEAALKPVQDVLERVSPGEVMPAGECPECGAVCHELDEEDEDGEE